MQHSPYLLLNDIDVSETDKNSFDFISRRMDSLISQLVVEKKRIKLCRNLYDGIRDENEFKYLEETFGMESPLSIKMTPLIKTRIDVLVGILLDETFEIKCTVSDHGSIKMALSQKKNLKLNSALELVHKRMRAELKPAKEGEAPKLPPEVDSLVISKLMQRIDESFMSTFEVAVQTLVIHFQQDATINLIQKIKQYFLDFLITGEAYYRTHTPYITGDPELTIIKPENVFYTKSTSHQFLSVGTNSNINAIIWREYLSSTQILQEYGHVMTESDKTNLFGSINNAASPGISRSPSNYRDLRTQANSSIVHTTMELYDTYPVYHVEFLANNEIKYSKEDIKNLTQVDKIKGPAEVNLRSFERKSGSGEVKSRGFRLDKYEGVRIGGNVYLNLGKSKHTPRSVGKPFKTKLSVNGVVYNDRNTGKPYSITFALKDLQDRYDIIGFFRDNLIANSGVNGSRVNLAAIPKVLGQNFMERLLKFIALRKQGIELIDPTEDGASLFNNYGDFSNSIDVRSIEALKIAMEMIQQDADIVSGVNRYMYQAAEQRDAVSNVKVGIKQTSLITKDIFELIKTSRLHMMSDLVNQAQITYKKGLRGSYILGDKQIAFDLAPEDFCYSDFNLHLVDSSKESQKINGVRQMLPEFVARGVLDESVLIEIAMSDSSSEIISLVKKNMRQKGIENDRVAQLSQQLEQSAQEMENMKKEVKSLNTKLHEATKTDFEIRKMEAEIRGRDVDSKIKDREDSIAIREAQVEADREKSIEIIRLEREQLYAENTKGNAREIKNNF